MTPLAIAVIVLTIAVVGLAFVVAAMRHTLVEHQRTLDALHKCIGNQARHLAAHDGLISLTRQEVKR